MKNLKFRTSIILAIFIGIFQFSASAKFIKSAAETIEVRQFTNFNKIDIGGGFKVVLKKADSQAVRIEVDMDDTKKISSEVKNETLIIRNTESDWNSSSVTIYIDMIDLKSVSVSGAVDLKSTTLFTAEKLNIFISGAGEVSLVIETKLILTKLRGAAQLNLKGTADTHAVECTGASELNAFDLVSDKYVLDLTGASDCEINVKSELAVTGSGASSIEYKGNPTRISKSTSGASELKQVF